MRFTSFPGLLIALALAEHRAPNIQPAALAPLLNESFHFKRLSSTNTSHRSAGTRAKRRWKNVKRGGTNSF